MSNETIAKIGGFTVSAVASTVSSAKDLGTANARNLIIYNFDLTNAVFVNSGASDVSVTFPTTSVGQHGAIIPPGQVFNYMKNNASDTHLGIISLGGSPTIYIQSANGE